MTHPSADLYGSDRMFLRSGLALQRAGARVVTSVASEGPLIPALVDAGLEVRPCAVPVLRKSALSPAGLLQLVMLAFQTLPAQIRLLREVRPDVLYVNTVVLPTWIVLGRLMRIPVVCHVREAEEGLPNLVRLGLTAPLRLASTLICNSRATKDVLSAGSPSIERRCRVLYNGLPLPDGPQRVLPGDDDPPGRPSLVLVGRLSPRKGTDVAIRALAEMRDNGTVADLHLVGDAYAGYEWYVSSLHALAAELDVVGQVHFDGFRADGQSLYDGYDVALVPSRVEPFGNVAVEALGAGVPVVAAAAQGLVEVLEGGGGRLVPTDDSSALAAATHELLTQSREERAELVARGRAQVTERFGLERYSRELADVVIPASASLRERPRPRIAVLTHIDLGDWKARAARGETAGALGPYGFEHLERAGLSVIWSDRSHSTSFSLRLLRRALRPLELRAATRGAVKALLSWRAVWRADLVLSLFEDQGMFAAQLHRFRVPGFRRKPHVVVVCWLADRVDAMDHRERWQVARALKGVDLIAVFSPNQERVLRERFAVDSSKIVAIPFGVATEFFVSVGGSSTGRDEFDVLAVGQDSARDYATLLRALDGQPWRARIVCREANVRGLEIPPNVTVESGADHQRYRQLLAAAKVVATPTTAPAYPSGQTVVLEAMAAGRANVVTDSAAMRDYLPPGTGVLVPAGDPAALRRGIGDLLHDDARREDIESAGLRHVQTHGDHAHMWAPLVSAIHELLEREYAQ